MIFQVLTLFFLFPRLFCDLYLFIEVFEEDDCDPESKEMFENHMLRLDESGDSGCVTFPFSGFVSRYVRDGGGGHVTFTGFQTNEECSSSSEHIFEEDVDLSICTHVSVDEKPLYLTMNINDSVPYDYESGESWFIGNYYQDEDCTTPMGVFSSASSFGARKGVYGNSAFFYYQALFCTENYLVYLSNVTDSYTLVSYQPKEGFLGVCVYGACSGVDTGNCYLKFLCETQSSVETDYFTKFPTKSTNLYDIESLYYDQNCSFLAYSRTPRPLDTCTEYSKSIATDEKFVELSYNNSRTCELPISSTSDILRQKDLFQFYYYENLVESLYTDSCFQRSYFGETVFKTIQLSDNPYLPSHLSIVSTYTVPCEEHDSDQMVEIMKNPNLAFRITYFDEEYCFSEEKSVLSNYVLPWPEDIVSLGVKSFKGKCGEDNDIQLKMYTQNTDCTGAYFNYDPTEEEICSVGALPILPFSHMICIPRYCGSHASTDYENVCSGRGVCTSLDNGDSSGCDCDSGYYGVECELFSCFDYPMNDEENVCSGHGNCTGIDRCECDLGFYGDKCESKWWVLFAVISFPILAGSSILICFLLLCCCCCLCISSCCILLILNVFFSPIFFISFRQRKKIDKFKQLEDFDLLLHEQLIEKDDSSAHLKINKDLFEVEYDEINISKLIGKGGSMASVFLCTWKGNSCVFKCFQTRFLCSSQESFSSFEKEVNLMINLNHPNIIRFFGASLKPPRVGILMEYCENGEILQFFLSYRNDENKPSEKAILDLKFQMMQQLISAMEYIHSRNIIHRDLKVENVLVDSNRNAKLMDFGISRAIRENSAMEARTKQVGTSFYMAPETFSGVYDYKIDVFSFAIMLYVMFSENANPYSGNRAESLNRVEFRVANDPSFRPNLDLLPEELLGDEYEWVRNVMIRCWDHKPSNRFDFIQLTEIFEKKKILLEIKTVEEGVE